MNSFYTPCFSSTKPCSPQQIPCTFYCSITNLSNANGTTPGTQQRPHIFTGNLLGAVIAPKNYIANDIFHLRVGVSWFKYSFVAKFNEKKKKPSNSVKLVKKLAFILIQWLDQRRNYFILLFFII